MKVIIACERTGIVRNEFIKAGHDAISCDKAPTESPGPHIQGDIRDQDLSGYDMIIAHPECRYLATSGNRWFKNNPERYLKQKEAIEFVIWLMLLDIKRIAIENPVSMISSYIRPADQVIQPWQFGHGETKAICLWLKNLPHLIPTDIVSGREARIHKMGSSLKNRSIERSKFYPGIAKAMADQWGSLC